MPLTPVDNTNAENVHAIPKKSATLKLRLFLFGLIALFAN